MLGELRASIIFPLSVLLRDIGRPEAGEEGDGGDVCEVGEVSDNGVGHSSSGHRVATLDSGTEELDDVDPW